METHAASSSSSPKASRAWKCFDLVLLGVVFAFLARWSWRKWPDVMVDYGLQLYTPWQLSLGKVLYRDVKYLAGGPLSQYFHALMFQSFGVSLSVLIGVNLALLALFILILYRLFTRAADRATALTACLTVLFVFAFSQFGFIGNYNFVCPYTYEATHGLLLSVVAIACLSRWITSRKTLWAFITGFLGGAVFLTKPDLFLALGITLAASTALLWNRPERFRSGMAFSILLLVVGALIPIAAFAVYFAVAWGPQHALNAITGSWLPLLTTSAAHNDFYKWCLGLDRPAANVALAVRHAAIVILTVTFAGSCARYFSQRNYVLTAALGAGLLLLVYWAAMRYPWMEAGSSFAPLTLFGCGFLGWKYWQTRGTPDQTRFIFPLLWSVFSLFLLAKMGFATRIWHYGFYLSLPAAVFLIFCMAWLLPHEFARFGVNARMFRILLAVLGVAGIVRLFSTSDMFYQARNLAVAGNGDRIYAFNRAVNETPYAIDLTIAWLQRNTSPTNTVATLPEGVMINYLARRSNPTPYAGFTLPEIQAYEEHTMVNAYEQNPPDYIVLIHRDSSEYGVGYFGTDRRFGFEMMNWIKTNYSAALLLGHEPLQTNRFGIKILRRNDLLSADAAAAP